MFNVYTDPDYPFGIFKLFFSSYQGFFDRAGVAANKEATEPMIPIG
jgi:hypothetical protein